MIVNTPLYPDQPLRNAITKAYRMDETDCIIQLLATLTFTEEAQAQINHQAERLVVEMRAYRKKQGLLDKLLYQYDLSTNEGIALMCLAEALLRIPDTITLDKFISDKLSTVNWKHHISNENAFFINAATWSLLLSGKIYGPTLNNDKTWSATLNRAVGKIGTSMVRPVIMKMMQSIGNQFVMGETIEDALKRAQPLESMGYTFSYDMLGEAARTVDVAQHYLQAYEQAIKSIGRAAKTSSSFTNPSISIKLSALHPRYEFAQYETLLHDLPPILLKLAILAKDNHIALAIDAEETDRLDLSLTIFERVFSDPSLNNWEGLGLAVQAYQKRAFYVLDWLANLAQRQGKRIFVRLVKGAYWDTEIKLSQVFGLPGYPVFTRKPGTDVSYLACAKKMLAHPDLFYAQFGTHNAYSVAAIFQMAGNTPFEFQCLHGMGRPLYDQLITQNQQIPVRIYAPVGTHQDLLGYLVRRLLENGANNSFVNVIADEDMPIAKIIQNPVQRIQQLANKAHPFIPLPKDIHPSWQNSLGLDLSDQTVLENLQKQMNALHNITYHSASIINGEAQHQTTSETTYSPIHYDLITGKVHKANAATITAAIDTAYAARRRFAEIGVATRTEILERTADLLAEQMPEFIALITTEGGRGIAESIGEVREAIDYCRYYAYCARQDLQPQLLPGPTGETNTLSLHPRGVMACISPWNFPLAIFLGQIVANLAVGNPVIAKPAEQTPHIAYKAIQLLLAAGIPQDALQLLIGPGREIGTHLISDPRIAGVMFTGSTDTAQIINRNLAKRTGPLGILVAETGGQNVMIVDSSALIEQTIIDVCQSAFNSAGQRCSALRVLFVQEDIADKLLTMLSGYMHTLKVGDPRYLATDIGPVIDKAAQANLQQHYARMQQEAKLIAEVPLDPSLNGSYFAPCAFEIKDLSVLTEEIFGPILHVIRYQAHELDNVLESIIATGYGLTFGVQSRIETFATYITNQMPVGNMYINRNMIGAQVGVQPFGGEGLSGTGPKAGGPYYLHRLCYERMITNNITAVGGNARLVSLLEEDDG